MGRNLYRKKLDRLLSLSIDEDLISLISTVIAVQAGNEKALKVLPDMPVEALGTKLGSPFYVPPWSLETLVNELFATAKSNGFGKGLTRILDTTRFQTLRALLNVLVKLENAEDGIFLRNHHVLDEMARIAQRQFPWQRGFANAPLFYRSILLYGTGTAREFFESNAKISLPDFIKTGMLLAATLRSNDMTPRDRDLSQIGISPELREAALSKLAISHAAARERAASARNGRRHTAYSPSFLRDFPIIAFGERGERLRAPLPELITYRFTSGLYLDVVCGGAGVWTDIGRRFENYVLEYLQAMMSPYDVIGEVEYGAKKRRYRSPDVLVTSEGGVMAAFECKAKRMSFDARYADDQVTAASIGFNELAKGIFQIWRFFAHSRLGLTDGLRVSSNCQGVIVTADSWLTMASRQDDQVVAAAHALADAEGIIESQDRREIIVTQIDDVEFCLQQGTADSLLSACREIALGKKKGFMLSVAHVASQDGERAFPFKDRIPELLPWL